VDQKFGMYLHDRSRVVDYRIHAPGAVEGRKVAGSMCFGCPHHSDLQFRQRDDGESGVVIGGQDIPHADPTSFGSDHDAGVED
jgi:hypothetical protein